MFDNPDLIAVCVVGDGEAETGPLATGWHSNKFLNAAQDGAVLPILHLNGYKIANPTVLARISDEELDALLEGYGYRVYRVTGDDPGLVHQQLAATLDAVADEIAAIQHRAREQGLEDRPRWPMIVLRRPRAGPGPRSWTASRWKAPGGRTRCRCRRCGPTPSTCASSRSGCTATGPRSCSGRTAR